jgi:hypothetical protein
MGPIAQILNLYCGGQIQWGLDGVLGTQRIGLSRITGEVYFTFTPFLKVPVKGSKTVPSSL